jgi:hypothetical protein
LLLASAVVLLAPGSADVRAELPFGEALALDELLMSELELLLGDEVDTELF